MTTTKTYWPMFVLLLAAWPGPAPAARAAEPSGQSYAFLVACGAYDKAELKPLKYTRNDILAFYRTLLQTGFPKEHVVLMHDEQKKDYLPEARKIRRLLKALLAGLDEQDTLVVALSGHGVQFKGEEQAYFCPVDADLKDRTTLISLGEIYAELKRCKARRKLLLVDACRNDPQPALGKGRAEVSLEHLAGLTKVPVPEGVAALFSCSAGQESYEDPELKHGVFFHHVIQGWQGAAADRSGQVSLAALADYVIRTTPAYVRRQFRKAQVPSLKAEVSGTWLLRRIDLALAKLEEGVHAHDNKDYDLAIAYFNEALRRNPRYADAYANRARAYNLKGEYARALADCDQALRLDPDNVPAHLARAYTYRRKKDYDRAIAEATIALRLDPKSAKAYNSRGWAYHLKKQNPQALADLSRAIRLDPNYVFAYDNRGLVYERTGNHERALADFAAALRLDPKYAWAQANRGWVYLNLKQYDKAIAECTAALRLDPNNAKAYYNRGRAYHLKGKLDPAIADYSKALRLDLKYALAYRNRGGAYLDKKDYGRAIADYTAAIRLEPQNARAYLFRAHAYRDRKDYELALKDYNTALRLNVKSANAWAGRGRTYYFKKNYGRAIADLTEAIRLDPRYAKAYWRRYLAYKAKGDVLLAGWDRKKALQLDPGLGK